jgi:UDP-3-O-[3-hydroxymyristoyl] glucosamine N-acyltransferase
VIGIPLPSPTSLGHLAAQHGGTVDLGAASLSIVGLATLELAEASHLAPFLSRRYRRAALATGAAILVDAALADLIPEGRRWIHPHAAYAFARLLETLAPPPPPDERALAHIDVSAIVDATASIGAGVVIRAGAVIGPGTRIEPNAVIYGGSHLGARVLVGASAVIGRPGFGWTTSPGGPPVVRVPQLGGVRIEDDVEIGPLATIDAGTLAPTVIGRGTKLDAHVHVGHNAVIGPSSLVAAQAGFAGSVEIGAGALVGGQAGFADHVRVGAGAKIAAKAGVIGDVAAGATVAGYPAIDRARWLRATARALAELKRRAEPQR